MPSLTALIIVRAPTAGGQYYWVSILAPETSRNFLSYITGTLVNSLSQDSSPASGDICCFLSNQLFVSADLTFLGWLTTIAWISNVAAGGFISATMTQGLIVLNNPDYVFRRYHGTLLTFAFLLAAVFVNTILSRHLPKIEGAMMILHVFAFLGFVISLVYLAPHRSASDVFTIFINGGGWPNQSVSFCVGLIGNVATFVGKF